MPRNRLGAADRRVSHGTRYYHSHAGQEQQRKWVERARLAAAAYGFIETHLGSHPEFAERWHPRYDEGEHVYRLTSAEERDWRSFLREHRWAVGEHGRKRRVEEYLPPNREARPLSRAAEEARRRFTVEGLSRASQSYAARYS